MKRNLFYGVLVIVAMVLISVGLVASSADDYKVVKKAAAEKSYTSSGSASVFHIEVIDKKTKKAEVNIKLPLSLVEMMADNFADSICKEHTEKAKGSKTGMNIKNIDIKKILGELKKIGPTSLIEVDTEDESVKIWIE